jgi:hypothetical protein
VCNRKYGTDCARRQQENSLAERFTEIDRRFAYKHGKRIWLLYAEIDGRVIELSGNQLLSYTLFRGQALAQGGVFLPADVGKDEWHELVELRTAEMNAR